MRAAALATFVLRKFANNTALRKSQRQMLTDCIDDIFDSVSDAPKNIIPNQYAQHRSVGNIASNTDTSLRAHLHLNLTFVNNCFWTRPLSQSCKDFSIMW